MCWLPRTAALEGFRTKSKPSLSRGPFGWGKHTSDRKKWRRDGRRRGGHRARKRGGGVSGEERNECPLLNPQTSGNVIPISIEVPLWSYEGERSQTVLLSSLSLVLWLNYLWKTSIEGVWWVRKKKEEGFLPTMLKAKKRALKWTNKKKKKRKKCHINRRSCQGMWTQVQRASVELRLSSDGLRGNLSLSLSPSLVFGRDRISAALCTQITLAGHENNTPTGRRRKKKEEEMLWTEEPRSNRKASQKWMAFRLVFTEDGVHFITEGVEWLSPTHPGSASCSSTMRSLVPHRSWGAMLTSKQICAGQEESRLISSVQRRNSTWPQTKEPGYLSSGRCWFPK